MSMTEGQQWYQEEYLLSTHWKEIREKVYQKHPYCQICYKPYDLHPHHLSYERRGQKDEWKDIRMLCKNHHKKCHTILWIILLPRTDFYLHARYYQVKIFYRLGQFLLGLKR